MSLKVYKTFLQETKSELKVLNSIHEELEEDLQELKVVSQDTVEAQDIINAVGILAQTEFQEVVQYLVTQALQYVFGDKYSFVVVNRVVRNQSETYFYIEIDGKQYSLEDELGGGVLDVVSTALRFVFWAINIEKTDPVILLDEPLKFVSRDKLEYVGRMLESLTETLQIQLIMISHEHGLINIANRSFEVTINNGISNVERLK